MAIRHPKPATMLAAVLASEIPIAAHQAALDAESLVTLGKRAARIAERRCNGVERWSAEHRRMLSQWTQADEDAADKVEARILQSATSILQRYGAHDVKAGGDPRGFCLRFRLASGRGNSMASGVWGV